MGDVQMDLSQTITNTSLLGICKDKFCSWRYQKSMIQLCLSIADQPNIHPGCISSTGRNGRQSAVPTLTTGTQSTITGLATTPLAGINLSNSNIGASNILLPQTSTQNQAAQQLIGGAISPSLFVTTPLTSNNLGHHQVILNNLQTQMPIQPVSAVAGVWKTKSEIFIVFFLLLQQFGHDLSLWQHQWMFRFVVLTSHMFLYVKSFFFSF